VEIKQMFSNGASLLLIRDTIIKMPDLIKNWRGVNLSGIASPIRNGNTLLKFMPLAMLKTTYK
jgi:hypothetical protein